jgi:hypothetical protein
MPIYLRSGILFLIKNLKKYVFIRYISRIPKSLFLAVILFLNKSPKKGSKLWLIYKENYYGGFVANIRRNVTSDQDERNLENSSHRYTGGDRMFHHNYAKYYSNKLKNFLNKKICLCEVGILRGSGLAVWSDLFPDSRIIGLDIDLTHFYNNLSYLKYKNAFSLKDPELYIFDQFKSNNKKIKSFLNGDKINVVIDDGHHSDESILQTFKSFLPFLDSNFVYFIESRS